MTVPDHHPRMHMGRYNQFAPATTAALTALGSAVDESGLDKSLTELLKLRVSQINGCAYCVQHHLNLLRKLGVAASKLDLMAVWREAGVFSAGERAALAWAEALTLMAAAPVSDAVYKDLQLQFEESEIAFLTAAIANINAWNRIAGSLLYTPAIPAAGV